MQTMHHLDNRVEMPSFTSVHNCSWHKVRDWFVYFCTTKLSTNNIVCVCLSNNIFVFHKWFTSNIKHFIILSAWQHTGQYKHCIEKNTGHSVLEATDCVKSGLVLKTLKG